MPSLDTSILAAYYSDARLNLLNCLNDLRLKNGMPKPIQDDAEIVSAFTSLKLSSASPEEKDKLIKQLRNSFPFINVLTDAWQMRKGKGSKAQKTHVAGPAEYEEVMQRLCRWINALRNTMVHPTDSEMCFDAAECQALFHDLKDIYDSGLGVAKERLNIENDTIDPLRRCASFGSGKGRSKPIKQFALALCVDPKSLEGRESIPQSQVLHDFGHVVLCSLFLDKTQVAELVNHFWLAGYNQYKRQWHPDEQSIAKEIAAVYRLRLPLQKLSSQDSTTSVTLDSLSHLTRCPRDLLDTLSPDDKARFRTETVELEALLEDGDTTTSSYLFARSNFNRFTSLLMRFMEFDKSCKLRFAVDLGQYHYNVRFKPGSHFTDQRPRVRRLGQKIIHYTRLQECLDSEKNETWRQLEQNYIDAHDEFNQMCAESLDDEVKPMRAFIIPTQPHYHYAEDRIGIRLAGSENTSGYPELPTSQPEEARCQQAFSSSSMAPDFWLSSVQLLHVAFYEHLRSEGGNALSIDILLKKYRSGMERLLNNLLEGGPNFIEPADSDERFQAAQRWINDCFNNRDGQEFSVSLNDLPNVLKAHLLGREGKKISVGAVKERAEHLLHNTERRLLRLNNVLTTFKKRGKKGFEPIKCGPIGDFLADDLMRFQPVNADRSDGGKLNSQQYQILQKAMAYYGAHIKEPPKIVDLLERAGLLSGDYKHPFVDALNLTQQPDKYSGLLSFYEDYLKARKRYITNFIREIDASTVSDIPHWLKLRQSSTLNSWLSNFTDETGDLLKQEDRLGEPLPLPGNLLYQPVMRMVAAAMGLSETELYQQGEQQFVRDSQTVSVRPAFSWFIQQHLDAKSDAAQTMYAFHRNHRLFDNLMDTRGKKGKFKPKIKHYLSEGKRKEKLPKVKTLIQRLRDEGKAEDVEKVAGASRAYKRQERNVRHQSIEDMVIFLYAGRYLNSLQLSQGEDTSLWSLKNIEHTLLNTAIQYELAVPDTEKSLLHPACKIRNRGELRLLVRDRRLLSLLAYYPLSESVINHMEIRYELANYRRARIKMMQSIHELERAVESCYGAVLEKSVPEAERSSFGEGRHGDFLYVLYGLWITANPSDTDKQGFNQALQIRNALCHNEYPQTQDFASVVGVLSNERVPENPANHRKVSERLLAVLEKLYSPWMDLLASKKATTKPAMAKPASTEPLIITIRRERGKETT